MAQLGALIVTGQVQGVIRGSATTKGREGTIAVRSVAHEISTARDASGQVTGGWCIGR